MADQNQTSGAGKGRGRAGDQTAQPGQAEGLLPFGIQNPLTTGMPGTTPTSPGADDPTTVPGQVPDEVFGTQLVNDTGMDGSTGASSPVSSGASYTDPFGFLAGGGAGDETGGSTDTESQGNKYGENTMIGIAGTGQPKTTNIEGGSFLIGGKKV